MNVCDIEPWCRRGNGGTIGRTLLLPLSLPRAWKPSPLPRELAHERPLAGYALRAATKVRDAIGLPIAVGFAVLAEHPEEPFVHAFNVSRGEAIDLALAEHQPIAYWGYLPSREQLAVDRLSISVEAPGPTPFRHVLQRTASRAGTSP
jgi:hypothetical protein